MKLRHLTKRELEQLEDSCILNEELSKIAQMLARGKSIVQISFETGLSTRSVYRRIKEIRNRMARM